MWNFLKANRPESSLRVNLFLITLPVSAILFAVAFYMVWTTIHPIVTVWLAPGKIEYKLTEISWTGIGAFIGMVLAGYFTLIYGKKINKEVENADPNQPPVPPAP